MVEENNSKNIMEEIMGRDIMIKRVKPGDGELAEFGTIVRCNLKGYFYSVEQEERLSQDPFEILHDQSFQVGEGDAVPALELALRHSKQGETLHVYCSYRFGYGTAGRNYTEKSDSIESKPSDSSETAKSTSSTIPPNMDLEYELEILHHRGEKEFDPDFLKKHQALIDAAEDETTKSAVMSRILTMQMMSGRKEAGNRWFSCADYGRAAKSYSKATQLAEGYFNATSGTPREGEDEGKEKTIEEKALEMAEKNAQRIPAEDSEVVNIYVSCLNNLAACKLSQKDYYKAKELCVKVLEFSPYNGKALLRAARAALATDSFEECELCIKRLLQFDQIDPQIKLAAKVELARLRKAQADYKVKSKEIQRKIANKLFQAKSVDTSSVDHSPAAVKDQPSPQETATSGAATVENGPDNKEVEKQPASASTEAPAPKAATTSTSKASNNTVLLVATSLAVVLISIILAFSSRGRSAAV